MCWPQARPGKSKKKRSGNKHALSSHQKSFKVIQLNLTFQANNTFHKSIFWIIFWIQSHLCLICFIFITTFQPISQFFSRYSYCVIQRKINEEKIGINLNPKRIKCINSIWRVFFCVCTSLAIWLFKFITKFIKSIAIHSIGHYTEWSKKNNDASQKSLWESIKKK